MTLHSGSGSTWGNDEGWCSNLMWSEIICQLQPAEHLTFSAAPEGSRPWLTATEGETLFRFTRNYLFLPLPSSQGMALSGACLTWKKSVCCAAWVRLPSSLTETDRVHECTVSWVWCDAEVNLESTHWVNRCPWLLLECVTHVYRGQRGMW